MISTHGAANPTEGEYQEKHEYGSDSLAQGVDNWVSGFEIWLGYVDGFVFHVLIIR